MSSSKSDFDKVLAEFREKMPENASMIISYIRDTNDPENKDLVLDFILSAHGDSPNKDLADIPFDTAIMVQAYQMAVTMVQQVVGPSEAEPTELAFTSRSKELN